MRSGPRPTLISKDAMARIVVTLGPMAVVLLDSVVVGRAAETSIVLALRRPDTLALVAFVVALLLGHWFHPKEDAKPVFGLVKRPWHYAVLVPLTALAGLACFSWVDAAAHADWLPLLMLGTGFASGAIVWPVGSE